MTQSTPRFKRILLKISGESFASSDAIFSMESLTFYAKQIAEAYHAGVQIGIVTGGGNILRGSRSHTDLVQRTTRDQVGMLATVMNSLYLRDILESLNIPTNLLCSFPLQGVAPSFDPHFARNALNHSVVIYAGGIANPFFSTDTCAAIRAIETQCDLLVKLTECGGIYDSDPKKNPQALLIPLLTTEEVLQNRYGVMDLSAFSLCCDHKMPIIVTKLDQECRLIELSFDKKCGTFVQP